MFFDTLGEYADSWLYAAAPILVVSVFVVALWHLVNWTTPFSDTDELLGKSNYAYAVQRISLCVAQVVGSLHILQYSVETDGWNAVGSMLVEGLWVFGALFFARLVVDFVLLPKIPNVQELLKGNLAVGVTEAGFYVAFGFILNGSLDGSSPSFGTGLVSTVVFGLLGLAVVIAMFFIHELVTRYDLRKSLEDGNMNSAIEIASLLIALAIVVRAGVAGDFTTWGAGFAAFFATVIITIVTLYAFRWFIDKFVLLGCTVKSIHENGQVAASLVLGSLLIVIAFAVETALKAHL